MKKIDLNEYMGLLSKSPELINKLQERIFLRTEIDVVYASFTNWERKGLLYQQADVEKGKWKKLTITEYLWVKLVEELRNYGFSYGQIIAIKNEITASYTKEELLKAIFENIDTIRKINPDAASLLMLHKDNKKLLDLFYFEMSFLHTLILRVICENEKLSILFYKDSLDDISVVSNSMLRDAEKKGFLASILKSVNRTHLNVSINQILSKFTKGVSGLNNHSFSLISKQEHEILKILRNKPKDVTSITVKYKDQNPDIIEMQSYKPIEAESRIMDHIKKGDYLSMKLMVQDGHITSCENINKFKL